MERWIISLFCWLLFKLLLLAIIRENTTWLRINSPPFASFIFVKRQIRGGNFETYPSLFRLHEMASCSRQGIHTCFETNDNQQWQHRWYRFKEKTALYLWKKPMLFWTASWWNWQIKTWTKAIMMKIIRLLSQQCWHQWWPCSVFMNQTTIFRNRLLLDRIL